jgi:radical SAM protein with 4Fe4S-binding SPASM domain
MQLIKDQFERKLLRQRIMSVPQYLSELALVRNSDDLYRWTYFKFPYLFALPDFPTRLTVEFTNACNFQCPHCWRETMDRKVGFMEVALFKKIVEEMIPYKNRTDLKIIGLGEPCLHPHFRELMGMLRQNHISPLLYTNGTLLSRFAHEEILQWNVQRLVVSIDGLDAEGFGRLRVGGNYETIRKDVQDFFQVRRKLKAGSPEIEVRHVIMPEESSKQLLAFRRDWKGLCDGVKFNFVVPLTACEPAASRGKSRCRDVRREFYIECDGRAPACGYGYSREHIGNLHEQTIKDVWMGPRKQQLRILHQQQNLEEVPRCKSCSHR